MKARATDKPAPDTAACARKMPQAEKKTHQEIGRAVLAYLKEHQISQDEVAARVGYTHRQAVSTQLHRRSFGCKTARIWAEAFGFNENFLLTGEGELLRNSTLDEIDSLKKENERLLETVHSLSETVRILTERMQTEARNWPQ